MTQKEILTALLEGKKLHDKNWNFTIYIHLVGENIVNNNNQFCSIASIADDCELYIETVTFFEALEAMKEGKRAKKINSDSVIFFNKFGFLSYFQNLHNFEVTIKDMNAKWIILEGDNK